MVGRCDGFRLISARIRAQSSGERSGGGCSIAVEAEVEVEDEPEATSIGSVEDDANDCPCKGARLGPMLDIDMALGLVLVLVLSTDSDNKNKKG